ncbi:MAG: MBL fold metallo-hydrolase [Candidatus Lokiarchaeota archaeon]|nr:MBL fold metallo-hydrolase [Candidatus Lokiarchaeota archaeon]
MSNLDIKKIKELLEEFPLNQDKEIISKFIAGEKLSQREILRAFHMSFPLFTLVVLNKRFEMNKQLAENEWSSANIEKLDGVGTVKSLKIVPLIDFHAKGNFSTEEGVSYYIKADDIGLLFDTGLNSKDEHPSPLLKNMEVLGISPEDFNYIFISHLHADHVGGAKWSRNRTFSLSGTQQNLSHVDVFAPVSMNHPTATVNQVKEPIVIANGIASIGPIQSSMFFFGPTFEQALAINVEGKGIVVIVGCGHQGIQKIIDRVETLFDIPIYGIIGGLHLPIPEFPGEDITWSGLPIFKFVMTRRPPWEPWQKNDRDFALNYLKSRNPKLVSLSPHDSSTESIQAFKQAFKEAYTDLKVGKIINI